MIKVSFFKKHFMYLFLNSIFLNFIVKKFFEKIRISYYSKLTEHGVEAGGGINAWRSALGLQTVSSPLRSYSVRRF